MVDYRPSVSRVSAKDYTLPKCKGPDINLQDIERRKSNSLFTAVNSHAVAARRDINESGVLFGETDRGGCEPSLSPKMDPGKGSFFVL